MAGNINFDAEDTQAQKNINVFWRVENLLLLTLSVCTPEESKS